MIHHVLTLDETYVTTRSHGGGIVLYLEAIICADSLAEADKATSTSMGFRREAWFGGVGHGCSCGVVYRFPEGEEEEVGYRRNRSMIRVFEVVVVCEDPPNMVRKLFPNTLA